MLIWIFRIQFYESMTWIVRISNHSKLYKLHEFLASTLNIAKCCLVIFSIWFFLFQSQEKAPFALFQFILFKPQKRWESQLVGIYPTDDCRPSRPKVDRLRRNKDSIKQHCNDKTKHVCSVENMHLHQMFCKTACNPRWKANHCWNVLTAGLSGTSFTGYPLPDVAAGINLKNQVTLHSCQSWKTCRVKFSRRTCSEKSRQPEETSARGCQALLRWELNKCTLRQLFRWVVCFLHFLNLWRAFSKETKKNLRKKRESGVTSRGTQSPPQFIFPFFGHF